MMAETAPTPLTIAITGATGLIGRALCENLAARGHAIRAMVRRPDASLANDQITVHSCNLPEEIDEAALEGCDAVIHAAYVTRFRSLAEAKEVNEVGTQRMLELSRRVGVPRFVFLTSASAHAEAKSYYGRSKYRLEQLMDPSRDLIIRPGLVLASRGGLFARIAATRKAKRWNVPVFAGGRQPMQAIHIDDFCEGVCRAVEGQFTGTLTIASPERTTVKEFFAAVAERLGPRPLFVNLPVGLTVAGLRLAERLGMRLPISSENVLGVVQLRYWDCQADLARIGLGVRPLREALRDLHPVASEPGKCR